MPKSPPIKHLTRSSKEAYFFGALSLLSSVVRVNMVWKALIALVLVVIASDFSFHELPIKRMWLKIMAATGVCIVICGFLGWGEVRDRQEDKQRIAYERLPLCNKSNTMVFWLVNEQRNYNRKLAESLKKDPGSVVMNEMVHALATHDKNTLSAINGVVAANTKPLRDEYQQRYFSHTEEMEGLADEMLAKMGKSGPKLAFLELARSENAFLGSLGLDDTANYFTELSKQLGCPTPPVPWNQ